MKEKIIVIVGPTAVGKTDISIHLAKELGAEIISADSMQIYKYMDIGTAKPSKDEMQGVKHYLIDEIDPAEAFSVANFKELSNKYINDILLKGKLPLIVGGTGLYVNAITLPWDFTETASNEEYRLELDKLVKEKGKEHLYEMLKKIDPESAEIIHPNNVKRVIRALEIYKNTGKTKSQSNKESMKKELEYEPIVIGLNMEREKLYNRINMRVDIMLENGLVEEVENLLINGYDKNLTSMQGLGYKEIVKYLDGEYTYDYAVEILKRDTRRFAKRQLTWFRRDERIDWFNIDDYKNKENLVQDIMNIITS